MNRLTVYNNILDEVNFEVPSDREGAYNILDIARYSDEEEKENILLSIADRLLAYEDTGLEAEEVKQLNASDASKEESSIKYYNKMRKYRDELKYYKKLEEQGLLIKLPCKVDDTVYTTFCDKVYEKTIDKIIINRFTTPRIWVETKLPFATSSLERWDIAIGKTIFATREEAEKALEVENE